MQSNSRSLKIKLLADNKLQNCYHRGTECERFGNFTRSHAADTRTAQVAVWCSGFSSAVMQSCGNGLFVRCQSAQTVGMIMAVKLKLIERFMVTMTRFGETIAVNVVRHEVINHLNVAAAKISDSRIAGGWASFVSVLYPLRLICVNNLQYMNQVQWLLLLSTINHYTRQRRWWVAPYRARSAMFSACMPMLCITLYYSLIHWTTTVFKWGFMITGTGSTFSEELF